MKNGFSIFHSISSSYEIINYFIFTSWSIIVKFCMHVQVEGMYRSSFSQFQEHQFWATKFNQVFKRVFRTNNKYVFHSYVLLVIKTSSQIRYCSNKCPQRLFDFEALRCNALWLMVLKKRLSSQRGKGKLNS